MNNEESRRIWNERAETHAAKKRDRSTDRPGRLYHDSWWRYIEPLLPEIEGGRILEAGCGTGRWAEHLVPRGFTLVMSDLSPAMLDEAKQDAVRRGYADRVAFEELDVCDMHTLEDNSFDMVISTGEPVSICSDPVKAIGEYCRVARPGGFVLCDAGNRYRKALDTFLADQSDSFMHILETGELTANGMRLNFLGPSELVAALEGFGMEVKSLAGITPMFSFPPNAASKRAMQNEAACRALEKLGRDYAQREEVIALSSRIIAVARKPL